jgi:hypothetical protein
MSNCVVGDFSAHFDTVKNSTIQTQVSASPSEWLAIMLYIGMSWVQILVRGQAMLTEIVPCFRNFREVTCGTVPQIKRRLVSEMFVIH